MMMGILCSKNGDVLQLTWFLNIGIIPTAIPCDEIQAKNLLDTMVSSLSFSLGCELFQCLAPGMGTVEIGFHDVVNQ